MFFLWVLLTKELPSLCMAFWIQNWIRCHYVVSSSVHMSPSIKRLLLVAVDVGILSCLPKSHFLKHSLERDASLSLLYHLLVHPFVVILVLPTFLLRVVLVGWILILLAWRGLLLLATYFALDRLHRSC